MNFGEKINFFKDFYKKYMKIYFLAYKNTIKYIKIPIKPIKTYKNLEKPIKTYKNL